MIDVLNLLWIVPLSMMAGATLIVVLACVLVKGDERKMFEDEECIKNDNRNA